ncbi:MAG: hypothetical protein ABUK01_00010 [Leptospirales bacterium]
MFKPYFTFEKIEGYLNDNIDTFIYGRTTEDRDRFLYESFLENKSIKQYQFIIEDDIIYFIYNQEKIIIDDVIRDLPQLLDDYSIAGCNLLLDITSIDHKILFILIKLLLTKFQPSYLFAGYTLPLEYKRDDEYNYELSFDAQNFANFPGYTTRLDSVSEKIIAVILGYEGGRVNSLVESITKCTTILPIISFPGVNSNAKSIAFEKNIGDLESHNSLGEFYYSSIYHPFDIIEILNEINNCYHNKKYQLIVAPLGARTQSLGTAIFATYNRVTPLFDFPSEKELRSSGVQSCFISHLSHLLKTI